MVAVQAPQPVLTYQGGPQQVFALPPPQQLRYQQYKQQPIQQTQYRPTQYLQQPSVQQARLPQAAYTQQVTYQPQQYNPYNAIYQQQQKFASGVKSTAATPLKEQSPTASQQLTSYANYKY